MLIGPLAVVLHRAQPMIMILALLMPSASAACVGSHGRFPAKELAAKLSTHAALRLDTTEATKDLLLPHSSDLDPSTLGSVLSCLKKKRSGDAAIATIAFALEKCPLVVNTQHLTIALKACQRSQQWQNSLALLESMQDVGHMPDVECLTTAATTCAACGAVDPSVDLVHLALARGMIPEAARCAPVIAALGRAQRGEEAIRLFRDLQGAGVAHDSISHSALVCALDDAEMPREALSAFRAMRAEELHPDQASYRAALAAARSVERMQLADEILAEGVALWHWAPRQGSWESYPAVIGQAAPTAPAKGLAAAKAVLEEQADLEAQAERRVERAVKTAALHDSRTQLLEELARIDAEIDRDSSRLDA